ncbi:MAG: FkbM family methyltransferase [Opitutae bacterium]|nr:FkbM family methyltransferase [Opitutae bacterium]
MTTTPDRPLPLPASLRVLRHLEFSGKLGLCDRLFGRALAAHGIVWVRTAVGPVWKLDLANVTHRWIVYGWYEGPALWHWLRRRRRPFRAVVDSGANIGQTALTFAALLPDAKIFAYEPGAAARAWLTESVAASGLGAIQVEPAGLGATAGSARLASEDNDERHGSWNKVNTERGEPIAVATMDDEMARLGLDQIDFWKLDMEGYEIHALRGAARALAAHRVRALYVEVGGEAGRPALELLRGHGYAVHSLADNGRPGALRDGEGYDNALCLAPGES